MKLFSTKTFIPILTFLFVSITNSYHAQNGIVKTYYTDGVVQSEISYVNDVLDGNSIWYYQNGKLKSEKNYSKGIIDGWVREYFESGKIKEEYFVENGIKNGVYRLLYENGALKKLATYSDGLQIQNQSFDYDPAYKDSTAQNKSVSIQKENLKLTIPEIKCNVEVCPTPIGGMKTIQENLIYPEHALRYGLEGTVILNATISDKGEVLKTEIVKKLGLGCDEAAQDAIRKTKFSPGQYKGVAVESKVIIEIEFKIIVKKSFPEVKEQ